MSELVLTVENAATFADRMLGLAGRLDSGLPVETTATMSFASLEILLRTLTPNRWALLKALHACGPTSIRALAIALRRDYKAVHGDVAGLLGAGLIERRPDGLIHAPWSRITAHLSLEAA